MNTLDIDEAKSFLPLIGFPKELTLNHIGNAQHEVFNQMRSGKAAVLVHQIEIFKAAPFAYVLDYDHEMENVDGYAGTILGMPILVDTKQPKNVVTVFSYGNKESGIYQHHIVLDNVTW